MVNRNSLKSVTVCGSRSTLKSLAEKLGCGALLPGMSPGFRRGKVTRFSVAAGGEANLFSEYDAGAAGSCSWTSRQDAGKDISSVYLQDMLGNVMSLDEHQEPSSAPAAQGPLGKSTRCQDIAVRPSTLLPLPLPPLTHLRRSHLSRWSPYVPYYCCQINVNPLSSRSSCLPSPPYSRRWCLVRAGNACISPTGKRP